MTQSGIGLNRIKDALRHADIGTTLTYARLGDDAVREAMEQHGLKTRAVTKRDKPTLVVDNA